jgi:MinD superfamily P-loop ATPase
VARIDPEACTRCGECIARCRFGALAEGPDGAVAVDELRCEGCGMCALVCPVTEGGGAVALVPRLVGTVLESETTFGPLVHAELAVGAEASGRLVTELRRQAQAGAALRGAEEMLMDGPPGTGCPVNASVVDTDLAVVVTEPGVAARHDVERALELLRFLGVAAVVVINKCDINDRERELLKTVAQRYGAPVVAQIPFDRSIVDALAQGTPPVLSEDCLSRDLLRGLAEVIRERLRSATVVAGERR